MFLRQSLGFRSGEIDLPVPQGAEEDADSLEFKRGRTLANLGGLAVLIVVILAAKVDPEEVKRQARGWQDRLYLSVVTALGVGQSVNVSSQRVSVSRLAR